ncbi:RebB family R body protein [Vitiosangium sp. GDMCC 1.1324]|uniref:RebB family R body protein n=1 Tax=Vitiosangium sp. (strain GDMCC 1.1324) TaxID=2138576 RepID=UPI000D3B473A|nr:RebB family R body protein [Vitiosangium sp. GDMCC 1.1324]PTL83714.1 RebB like protein [Vitiosangium sp. GDMCC 1.1324]
MAEPTAVNDQITDSVTQSGVEVLASSPAMALSHLYQTMAYSAGLSFQNAVTNQQRLNVIGQAAAVQGVNLLYSLDTAADAVATSKVGMSDLPTALASLGAAVKASK